MSDSIDQRIVEMRFDNAQFEKGVQTSIETLNKLEKSLELKGSEKSLESLQKAADGVSFGKLEKSVNNLSKAFDWENIFRITALQRVADKVINAGERMIKSISTDQIGAGMSKYELKTKSVQQIMAATGDSIKKVESVLSRLNYYTDMTSYDFAEMAGNIGKFTSAGVDLETAEAAMEGIANWAARSGQETAAANRAMYNMSQALSTGKVMVRDWMSIENANMATKEFKETAIETAIELGKLQRVSEGVGLGKKGKTIDYKSFRETLSDGWFDNEVLIATLQKYADTSGGPGTLGYESYQMAKIALTFTQAMQAIKDSVSTGWMNSFQILFGNVQEAGDFFTWFCDTVIATTSALDDARNSLLGGWAESGGKRLLFGDFTEGGYLEGNRIPGALDLLLDEITSFGHAIYMAVDQVLNPLNYLVPNAEGIIGEFASLPIYASETLNIFDGNALTRASEGIYNFFGFIWDFLDGADFRGKSRLTNIVDIFTGVFSVLDIGRQIISGIIGLIKNALIFLSPTLDVIGVIGSELGRFFYGLDLWLRGGKAEDIFKKIGEALKPVGEFINTAATAVYNFFKGLIKGIKDAKIFEKVGKALGKVFEWIKKRVEGLFGVLSAVFAWFGTQGENVANWIDLAILKIELFGHRVGLILDPIRKAFDNTFGKIGDIIKKNFEDPEGGGFFDRLKKSWEEIKALDWGQITTGFNSAWAKLKQTIQEKTGLDISFLDRWWAEIEGWSGWTWISDKVTSAWDWFTKPVEDEAHFDEASQTYRTGFLQMIEDIKATWEGIKAWPIWETLGTFFSGVWDSIWGYFTKPVEDKDHLIEGTTDQYRTQFQQVFKDIESAWESIKAWPIWGTLGTFFSGIWDSVWGFFTKEDHLIGTGAFEDPYQAVTGFNALIDGIKRAYSGLISWEGWTEISNFFVNLWDSIWGYFTKPVEDKDHFDDATQTYRTKFQQQLKAVGDSIKQLLSTLGLEDLWTSVETWWTTPEDGSDATGFAKVWATITSAYESAKTWVETEGAGIISAIGGFFSNIWETLFGVPIEQKATNNILGGFELFTKNLSKEQYLKLLGVTQTGNRRPPNAVAIAGTKGGAGVAQDLMAADGHTLLGNRPLGWFTLNSGEENLEESTGIVGFLSRAINKIKEFWEQSGLKGVANEIVGFFTDLWNSVSKFFTEPNKDTGKTGFIESVEKVFNFISELIGKVRGWTGWQKLGPVISQIFTAIANVLFPQESTELKNVTNQKTVTTTVAPRLFDSLGELLGVIFGGVFNLLGYETEGEKAQKAFEDIGKILTSALDILVDVIGFIAAPESAAGKLVNFLGVSAFVELVSGLLGALSTLIPALTARLIAGSAVDQIVNVSTTIASVGFAMIGLALAVSTFGGMEPGKLAQGVAAVELLLTSVGSIIAAIMRYSNKNPYGLGGPSSTSTGKGFWAQNGADFIDKLITMGGIALALDIFIKNADHLKGLDFGTLAGFGVAFVAIIVAVSGAMLALSKIPKSASGTALVGGLAFGGIIAVLGAVFEGIKWLDGFVESDLKIRQAQAAEEASKAYVNIMKNVSLAMQEITSDDYEKVLTMLDSLDKLANTLTIINEFMYGTTDPGSGVYLHSEYNPEVFKGFEALGNFLTQYTEVIKTVSKSIDEYQFNRGAVAIVRDDILALDSLLVLAEKFNGFNQENFAVVENGGVANGLQQFLDTVQPFLETMLYEIPGTGVSIAGEIGSLMNTIYKAMSQDINSVTSDGVIENIRKNMETSANNNYDMFESIGAIMATAIAEGIRKGSALIVNEGSLAGTNVIKAYNNAISAAGVPASVEGWNDDVTENIYDTLGTLGWTKDRDGNLVPPEYGDYSWMDPQSKGETYSTSSGTASNGKSFSYVDAVKSIDASTKSVEESIASSKETIGASLAEWASMFAVDENGSFTISGQVYDLTAFEAMAGSIDSSLAAIDKPLQEAVQVARAYISKFVTVGKQFSLGLSEGIKATASNPVASARELAQKVLATMQEAWVVHSPSEKAFTIGEYFALGLAEGIDETTDPVLESVNRLGDKILDETESVFDKIRAKGGWIVASASASDLDNAGAKHNASEEAREKAEEVRKKYGLDNNKKTGNKPNTGSLWDSITDYNSLNGDGSVVDRTKVLKPNELGQEQWTDVTADGRVILNTMDAQGHITSEVIGYDYDTAQNYKESKKKSGSGGGGTSKPKTLLSGVLDAFDKDLTYTPDITPVIDWSNVYVSSANASETFRKSNALDFGTFGTTDVNGALNRNGSADSSVLVGLVKEIRDLVQTLDTNITSLDVVLDTGTLAGSLAPKIDGIIGRNTVLSGRGN